ncbi:MAG: hypothetical protein ACUVWY_11280 [Desulfosoma sp.]|uniref:hypothetical protein n=1 Tax=Desulfosoma sp. TaxID=2603217 RepID=UPI00404A2649
MASKSSGCAPRPGQCGGGWSFEDGWLPSCPETSGYLVETFLAAALRTSKMLVRLQRPDGSLAGA